MTAKSPQVAMYAAALMELVAAFNLVVGAVAGVVMKAGTTSADDQDPEYLRPGIKTTYASCSFDREFANIKYGDTVTDSTLSISPLVSCTNGPWGGSRMAPGVRWQEAGAHD